MLQGRVARNLFSLHPEDAALFKVEKGSNVALELDGRQIEGVVDLDPWQPQGVVLVTRSMGALLSSPMAVKLRLLKPAAQAV